MMLLNSCAQVTNYSCKWKNVNCMYYWWNRLNLNWKLKTFSPWLWYTTVYYNIQWQMHRLNCILPELTFEIKQYVVSCHRWLRSNEFKMFLQKLSSLGKLQKTKKMLWECTIGAPNPDWVRDGGMGASWKTWCVSWVLKKE